MICFAGIKNDLITLGTDISYKTNFDLIGGHNAWGISGTGAIRISEKTEFFGRFDHLSSIKPAAEKMQWHFLNDYNFVIAGLQYAFSENVRIAIDYQGTYHYLPESNVTEALYLNALYKF